MLQVGLSLRWNVTLGEHTPNSYLVNCWHKQWVEQQANEQPGTACLKSLSEQKSVQSLTDKTVISQDCSTPFDVQEFWQITLGTREKDFYFIAVSSFFFTFVCTCGRDLDSERKWESILQGVWSYHNRFSSILLLGFSNMYSCLVFYCIVF